MQGELFDNFVSPAETLNSNGYEARFVLQVVGITYRQIDYWVREGVITPSIKTPEGSGTRRLFSFKDIIFLKTIKSLKTHGIPLNKIKKSIQNLNKLSIDNLTSVKIFSNGKDIFFSSDNSEIIDITNNNNGVLNLEIKPFVTEVVTDTIQMNNFLTNSVHSINEEFKDADLA